MQQLTQAGEQALKELGQRYGVSAEGVRALLDAVVQGGGTMAQFYIPELGGGGQWMRGGMTMVGDMFNHGLQATVSGLCQELSNLLAHHSVFLSTEAVAGHPGGAWWPEELGQPSTSGAQNDVRYAYFPDTRRLAIARDDRVQLYDTLDHRIGGVQQQQGGGAGTLSFSSQHGTFTVDSLPLAGGSAPQPSRPQPAQEAAAPAEAQSLRGHGEVLDALERLGSLHQRGVLSDAEFAAKKAELLARL